MMDTSTNPIDLFRILWRRKLFFLVPAGLIITSAVILTQILTPLYKSQATLLIETRDIPENVVPSLITEQIGLRLQVLERDILTTNNLLEIADRYNLYADEREMLTRGAIASRMRSHIDTQTVLTEFTEEGTGRPALATVGLTISFLHTDPQAAQMVVNELVTAYRSRNIEGRRAVAETTTDFLGGERAAIEERVESIENKLTEFNIENRELLPAEAAFKRQLLNNIEQQLRGLEGDLQVLRERESYISTQLALINEFDVAGGRGGGLAGTLEVLRGELASARARYSSTHPDVVRLQREVRSLGSMVAASGGSSALAEQEALLRAELATLRESYTDDHPDVRRVQRELETVRTAIRNGSGNEEVAGATRNGAYIQLSAQLNGVQAEISAIEERRVALQEERVTLQEQVARAPTIEREYNTIIRQLESAIADRDALADKETAARLSSTLEASAAGESLSLAEPPTAPSSPSSPKKTLILAAGLVLAVGSGGFSVLMAQLLDRSIQSSRDLVRLLNDTPMVTIPFIKTAGDVRRTWLWRIAGAVAILVVATAGLSWVHTRVVPLDVIGYDAANKAEQWIATTRLRPVDHPLTVEAEAQ